jgi:hypothetical protein
MRGLLAPVLTCVRAIAAMLVAFAGAFIAGCSQDTSEIDRIAMPTRFALIRDTAQWVPEFDPAWWKPIDVAYAEYDQEAERIVRERWTPLVRELNLAGQTPGAMPPDDARARRARQRAIENELAVAERAMLSRIDAELPATADRFMALLSARIEFERATAVWAEPERPLPGPLEQLSRVGVHAGDDAAVGADALEAATIAYRDIAREARRLSNERGKAYLEWTEEFVALDAALQAARANAPGGKGRQVDRAQRAVDRRLESMRSARAQTTESLRMRLLEAGDAFALAIADDAVRAEFVERLEADLHEGMSTRRTMEMYARLAERVIAEAHPDDAARLDEFRADVARGLELQRTKRALLRADDPAVRKAAYKELSAMPGSIIESAGKKLDERLGRRLFWQAVRVDLGQIGEEDAVKAVFGQDPPPPADPNPADVAESIVKSGVDADRLAFYGTGLSPRILRWLSAGLRLEGEAAAEFDAIVEEETGRLRDFLKAESDRIEAAEKQVERAEAAADADAVRAVVRDVMSEVRSGTAAILSRNRAANARVLDAAMRLADVDASHPLIIEARIELEMLANIGSRGLGQRSGRRELETLAGVTVECYSSPFSVARLMDASDGDRDTAVALVAAHGDELVALAQATRARMLDNLEKFIELVAAGDRRVGFGVPPWHLDVAAPDAIALRFTIIAEIGEVLGPDVARAYERCWRRLERPALEQQRAAEIARLTALVERGALDPVLDVALRGALAASEGTREQAVRATHRWRAGTVVGDRLESADNWRTAIFSEPLGAFLYSRIADADERGIATCEVLATMAGEHESIRDDVRIRERPIVKTIRPWWP